MSGFQCPYCSMVMSISPFTYVSQSPSFSFSNGEAYKKENGETVDPSTLRIAFYKCPNCGQISINADFSGSCIAADGDISDTGSL